ncbi:polyribonucleotide nucleotidyltransferase [Candidatus Profftella armatura (Diaphorina cf. continua)]|uniref:Polyribonucleotide nucleotidyltransferase n=1 Tax=Candidatus Profftella armatura (Diaphorina cf. continua) TaxID=2661583 RepID=A0A7R6W0R1_9PROT|nr:polyribonucleotide nucleotidyltransferase [Candidatus Profftella armatura (Diaphorina cf. continua)]BCG49752.1 polyribonucleotide nucleotidyltransferase [Candidatus Profftella armatura (Diaphorina cf. continua)]
MFNKIIKEFKYGSHKISIEIGEIARQATSSVLVSIEDTVILATVVSCKNPKSTHNFFPLTVDYIEKTYAAGRIPGGFFKREGKPSERETIISRLIDRPIRPLFPEGYLNEIQVVIYVLSVNPQIDPDIASIIGVSTALSISELPFLGPLGVARVGYIDGKYILNPTTEQLKKSHLDLLVAGTEKAIITVESESKQLSEDIILDAIIFGHKKMKVVINIINELVKDVGQKKIDWNPIIKDEKLISKIVNMSENKIRKAYQIKDKQIRDITFKNISKDIHSSLMDSDNLIIDINDISCILYDLESKIIRTQILDKGFRIDNRGINDIRPISIRTGILPRAHGSSLFTRGDTQALVVATLGTSRDEQKIDALMGEFTDSFMLHYNMPSFATGEIGRIGVPKRREIGHGRLAKRALLPILPNSSKFNYSIRLVSEITESNGSSSMASVCGGCLALLDAGVPISEHVAGIAMGLIKDGEKVVILSDILGDEDHFGDMDFKVAGTNNGITALQMDIKIFGITYDIIKMTLYQARKGLSYILEKMKKAVPKCKTELSKFAPRLITVKIDPSKIRDVIGKGGSIIRALTEETGTQIDINDEGVITIVSFNAISGQEAKRRIEKLTESVKIGKIYTGIVLKLFNFGAIIRILSGKDGLLHISQISSKRVNIITDFLKENQKVRVKVLEIDDRGRIKLSMKALLEKENVTFLK